MCSVGVRGEALDGFDARVERIPLAEDPYRRVRILLRG
jgi:hypothetical protein